MRRPSIRTLLTAWFAIALLLIVMPLAAAVLVIQWRGAVDALNHHLQEDLEVAAQMLTQTPEGIGWAHPGHVDPGYDAGTERWVEVYSPEGRLMYTRGSARRLSAEWALPAARLEDPPYRTVLTPPGPQIRLHTSTRTVQGRPVVIRVVRAEDGIRQSWNRLALTFVLVIPLAVAMAAGAGHVMAGRMLAPIARISEHARRISAERLGERLLVENPNDELGELGQVFNATFERLESSFERLRQFGTDVSHELRTPLTAIRSVGEVGLREARNPETYREIIGSMLEETTRLTHLVDKLLTLSRWEAGQLEIKRRPVDLNSLASMIVAQFGPLAEEKGVILRTTGENPVLLVPADRDMLQQAITNVVDNAIKHTPAGGFVDVLVRRAGATAEVHVLDQGPGIPPQDASRVFERFYRVDKARARDVGGTGLGLAIARSAVEANLGRIDVFPGNGRGSRFVISLPCAPQA